jgi:hypothetical protein
MNRQGYRPTTIKASVKTLKALTKRCNFLIPSEFKNYLASAGYSENRKDNIISDVDRLYRQLAIKWERPLSRRVETLPFIPTEEEINQLPRGQVGRVGNFSRIIFRTESEVQVEGHNGGGWIFAVVKACLRNISVKIAFSRVKHHSQLEFRSQCASKRGYGQGYH